MKGEKLEERRREMRRINERRREVGGKDERLSLRQR